jgi:hypothetical protein
VCRRSVLPHDAERSAGCSDGEVALCTDRGLQIKNRAATTEGSHSTFASERVVRTLKEVLRHRRCHKQSPFRFFLSFGALQQVVWDGLVARCVFRRGMSRTLHVNARTEQCRGPEVPWRRGGVGGAWQSARPSLVSEIVSRGRTPCKHGPSYQL